MAVAIGIIIFFFAFNSDHTFLSFVHAQQSKLNNTVTTITAKDIVNITKPGQKVVLRGIVSSYNFNRVNIKTG
jgi:hypothetical protein